MIVEKLYRYVKIVFSIYLKKKVKHSRMFQVFATYVF